MNEVDKFLNSDLEPYEEFEITNKLKPTEIREYLETLGWDYSDYDTNYFDMWMHFYNPSTTKTRVSLHIDIDELKMWLYWRN